MEGARSAALSAVEQNQTRAVAEQKRARRNGECDNQMARLGRQWEGTGDLKKNEVSNEGFKVKTLADGGRSHLQGTNKLWRCLAISSSNVGHHGFKVRRVTRDR